MAAMFDSDVLTSGHLERGMFPETKLWDLSLCKPLRLVPKGFRNLTKLVVPHDVECFLSYGPKFMLPTYTLLSNPQTAIVWQNIQKELELASYYFPPASPDLKALEVTFNEYVGSRQFVLMIDKQLLHAASETAYFLKTHASSIVVEGDKGKIIGLIPRKAFSSLTDSFIEAGVLNGSLILLQLI